jgi:glycerophosphoryl diester phosphodiesterase
MMNYKKYALIVAAICLVGYLRTETVAAGAGKKKVQQQDQQEKSYRKLKDVAYSRDDKENVMDCYIPTNYENAKVIVYLHGSGWTGGDKKEFPEMLIEELVGKHKYIVVSANYRLVKDGQNRFPAQMEDINKLFTFLLRNASRYHFNGKEFALMGGSAGAHLAMLYAYGYDSAKLVKTVIDFWGPTDLADKSVWDENKDAAAKVMNLLGVTDPAAQICKDASPYYRVTKSTGVPTILFHGGQDPLVPVVQADKMYKKLVELDIPAQYEYYPDEKHGMRGAAGMEVFIKTMAWLDKYFPAS